MLRGVVCVVEEAKWLCEAYTTDRKKTCQLSCYLLAFAGFVSCSQAF